MTTKNKQQTDERKVDRVDGSKKSGAKDTLDAVAERLPAHWDSEHKIESQEPRGFPPDEDPEAGYHRAGTEEFDRATSSKDAEFDRAPDPKK